jgi:hypothetical protein
MEDHKVSRPPHVSVRNRYTIFLCEDDWDRLRDRKDQLVAQLEQLLAKHVRAKKYQTPGDISVEIVCDSDLKQGHFGILAEKDSRGFPDEARQRWDEELGMGLLAPGVPAGPAAGVPRVSVGSGKPVGAVPGRGGSVRKILPGNAADSTEGAGRRAPAQPAPEGSSRSARATQRVGQSGLEKGNGATKVIPPVEAMELGLARETIVIKSGNRAREFSQGRVVVGRAADADFRIDNPDVSRHHAALYWSNGAIVIEDLGSTNGTMVNGHPVSSATVSPNDVIVIGDCRLTAQAR